MTPRKHLLLIGAGHAHAQVLRAWIDSPVPDTRLTLVTPHALAPYSGMVPGWLAGTYRFEDICIDFEALARAAGANWVRGELDALDPDRRAAHLDHGQTLRYDLLSINVGSTLTPPPAPPGTRVLSMRPLSALRAGFEALLIEGVEGAEGAGASDALHLTAVGGGAAGFESVLGVVARLRTLWPQRPVHAQLMTRSAHVLQGSPPAVVRAAQAALQRAGVVVRARTAWSSEAAGPCDVLLWATGAEAHAWQRDPRRRGTLAVSDRGFIRVDETLRSVSHPDVFAVGDCCDWRSHPLPKAGVYAVRMGPVLVRNLRAALQDRPLQPYRPQREFLVLLNTADGRAIASRPPFHAQGPWMWRWKDHIDRGFLARFRCD